MIDIDLVLKKIKDNQENFVVNKMLFDILEGQLFDKVDNALRNSYISTRAYKVASRQIAPINIIAQITNKLSKIYSTGVARVASNQTDQEIMDYYVSEMNLDANMSEANRFYNTMKSSAVEPYLNNRNPKVRVIAPHQFIPISFNVTTPNEMDGFVKIINEDLMFIYTNEKFIAINGNGEKINEYSQDEINPYGVVPQTYINKSKHLLIPYADKDLLQMGLIVNIKLANLMYAVQYQTNSIIYGIDLNIEKLELNPDNFWDLHTSGDGKKPEIGMIKPEVDIDQVLTLIENVIEKFLNSRNLRGNGVAEVSTSGIALQIKNIDTTEDRKEQITYFTNVEKELWQKIKVMHNYWADAGLIDEPRKFSNEFDPMISFAPPHPIETRSEVVLRTKDLLQLGLITKQMALTEIFPNKGQNEIEEMLKQLEQSEIIRVENFANETSEV